jgi:hypothetical protein
MNDLNFEAASTAHLAKTFLRSIKINTDMDCIKKIENKIRNSMTTTYENTINEDRCPPFDYYYNIEKYIQQGAGGFVHSVIIRYVKKFAIEIM